MHRCTGCWDPHGARLASTPLHTWQPGCDLYDVLAARVADYLNSGEHEGG